jgi:hypothetical protein
MKDYEKALEFARAAQRIQPGGQSRDVELEVLRIIDARAARERRAALNPRP